MKNRINITLSDNDIKISEKLCEFYNMSRSELISDLLMMKMYDAIDSGRITYDELRKYLS